MKRSMTRTKRCLVVSLTIHVLAAIVAHYTVSLPTAMPIIVPAVESRNFPDALSVDVMEAGFVAREILLRRPMVRSQYEIKEAPKLTTYSSMREREKASLREKILAIDYTPEKEVVFLPILPWVPLSQPLGPASAIGPKFKPHQIKPRGAGRSSRSVSHQDLKRARELREIMYRKIMLKEKARSFFAALIDKDFARASAIAGGRYKDVKWEETRYADLVEIASIHEPYQQFQSKIVSGIEIFSGESRRRRLVGWKRDMLVPYEVRSASGQLISGKIIMRWEISDGSWFFEGGI